MFLLIALIQPAFNPADAYSVRSNSLDRLIDTKSAPFEIVDKSSANQDLPTSEPGYSDTELSSRELSEGNQSIPGALVAFVFGVFGLLVVGRRKTKADQSS